ncbi:MULTISPECIES: intermembrane phospholipid transport protein YdbH family protein [Oceanisphaera]|uniref:YdbH domain-containing protein n=1 Tax=Oceanisphaera ostreae TaxID=914151 RepID=A0ABW3KHH1_9GAMM
MRLSVTLSMPLTGLLFALWLISTPALALLPPNLQVQANLKRATVPACPKETASGLTITLDEGHLSGRLASLSLDLTCSRSQPDPHDTQTVDPADALSLLLTLPAIDFEIETLTLHLPEGVISGPAKLHHQQQHLDVLWQTDAGATQLSIMPKQSGWRWRGELPGHLLTPSLRQPVQLSGGWQPEQPFTLQVAGSLPAPLAGNWQLALNAELRQGQWQLSPRSQLTVDRLQWKNLTLKQLKLVPQGDLQLDKPWQARLSWQQGQWQQQRLPAAALQLRGEQNNPLRGTVLLELAPDLQLRGNWRYGLGDSGLNKGGLGGSSQLQGSNELALEIPTQSWSAVSVWSWLDSWLNLPVGLAPQAGQLRLSLSAPHLLDNKQPLMVQAELQDGQFGYRDMLAEQVAAKLKLLWSQKGLQSVGPQALSIAKLEIGVPITDINAALRWHQQGPWLSGLTAQALGGQLALSPMALTSKPSGELHASDISLEQILSYANVDGLTGSGQLHGRLPFAYDGGISVTQGRAHSDQGWISYKANQQLAATGEANISLGLTLGLLSDLRYDQLSATISMARTGEATVDTRLQGRAPVMGKMHPVNFNYHHQENLLQLLASLRFAQDLSEQLPARFQGESK